MRNLIKKKEKDLSFARSCRVYRVVCEVDKER